MVTHAVHPGETFRTQELHRAPSKHSHGKMAGSANVRGSIVRPPNAIQASGPGCRTKRPCKRKPQNGSQPRFRFCGVSTRAEKIQSASTGTREFPNWTQLTCILERSWAPTVCGKHLSAQREANEVR